MSISSNGSRERKKREKSAAKAREADRRVKLSAQSSEIDLGHLEELGGDILTSPVSFAGMKHGTSLERSSSDQSTGSLLYGKTPHSSNLLGKSGSLIFPTEAGTEADQESDTNKKRRVNLLLDQCETVRFPFKKKLSLNNLGLVLADLPVKDMVGTSLGNSLHKLSMEGNRLGSIPAQLVVGLPVLKHLDIAQCQLHQLPDKWNLPQLKRLNVSHNQLREFPEEVSALSGISFCSFSVIRIGNIGGPARTPGTQHVRK